MSKDTPANEISQWLSSYGIMTAERLLQKYRLKPGLSILMIALKNPQSLYYHFLLLPVKMIQNAIILEQAKDYQLFLQKLFIDYFLSGQNSKDSDSPGEDTRRRIRKMEQQFLELSEQLRNTETQHYECISKTQKELIALGKQFEAAWTPLIRQLSKTHDLRQKAIREAIFLALAEARGAQRYDESYKDSILTHFFENGGLSLSNEDKQKLVKDFQPFFKLLSQTASIDKNLDEILGIRETFKMLREQFEQQGQTLRESLSNLIDFYVNQDEMKEKVQDLDFDQLF